MYRVANALCTVGFLNFVRRDADLQKPISIGVLSAFLGRGADRRWGFGAR